ncbi:MAG: GNAT family N-acetyltransferase, partial [Verrucomicrobiota bacterium]
MEKIIKTAGPNHQPSDEYYACRYKVLRQPLGFPVGSERLEDDLASIHTWIELADQVIAIARAHSEDDNAFVIRQMGVDPDFARQGLGAQVLSAIEQAAVET